MSWPAPPDPADKPAYVRRMFARIVPRYDLINRLMTLGLDRRWRARAAELVSPTGGLVLDVAAGTGDLTLELLRQGARTVVGVDFCSEMLTAAASKARRYRGPGRMHLVAGDALALPFADNRFDGLVNAFLLRNVTDIGAAMREFRRVLRPGGRLACLDMTLAPRPLQPLLWPYFQLAIPVLGGLLSGDKEAYTYLPGSLRNHPVAPALCEIMRVAGWDSVSYCRLGMGTVAVHTAIKPG